MELFDYQQATIDMIWTRLYQRSDLRPVVDLPTGSGKSVVIAAFVMDALDRFPGTKVLILAHQKELVEQDADKLATFGVEHGVYCNGLGRKETGDVVVGSIQSVARHPELFGAVDVLIVDEAHRINTENEGQYRQVYTYLKEQQPGMRIIGFTATPFRTGAGWLFGEGKLFNSIVKGITIFDLQEEGRLVRLTSKATQTRLDTDGVKVSHGDFVEKDLEAKLDVKVLNNRVIDEVIERAADRRSWIVFCAGVAHAQHVAEVLNDKGIPSACVTGQTPDIERSEILARFKKGELRAVTNCNVLTTGFDAPNVDLLVMLRPTLSPVLYVQMMGRGLRTIKDENGNTLWEKKKDCLVLDFAANVLRHGPIIDVDPMSQENMFSHGKGEGKGVAPAKVCPECFEIVPISTMECPSCHHSFRKDEEENTYASLSLVDPNGTEVFELVTWDWGIYANTRGSLSFMCELLTADRRFVVFYPVSERMNGLMWRIIKTFHVDGRGLWPIHQYMDETVRRLNEQGQVYGRRIRGHYNERHFFTVTNWDYDKRKEA